MNEEMTTDEHLENAAREIMKNKTLKMGPNKLAKSYGAKNHKLGARWRAMILRCYDPTNKDFQHYGGRGIKVCNRWFYFQMFLADMENSFRDGLTLERKDNNGNYCPQNCRWATRLEQSQNKRGLRLFRLAGLSKTLNQWAASFGIHPKTLRSRINSGMKLAHALKF